MKDKDYSKAKELFWKYNGMLFFMWHEGELDEYKQFEVPEELEREWRIEELDKRKVIIRNITDQEQLELYISNYIDIVGELESKEELCFIKKFFEEQSENMDSFTLVLIAEKIIKIICIENNMIKRKELILDILKVVRNALNGELIISDDYKKDGVLPGYRSEDIIVERLQDAVKMYKRELYYCDMCYNGHASDRKFNVSEKEHNYEQRYLAEMSGKVKAEMEIGLMEMLGGNQERFSHYFCIYMFITEGLKSKEKLYLMKRLFEEEYKKMDSFTLLMSAIWISEIIYIEDDPIKRKEFARDILKILRNALNGEIIISDDYKDDGVLPEYISEDIIVERLQDTIKKYEKEAG